MITKPLFQDLRPWRGLQCSSWLAGCKELCSGSSVCHLVCKLARCSAMERSFALHLISGCDKGHMKDAYEKCALRLPLTVKGHLQVLQQLPLPRQLLGMTLRPLHLLQQVTHVLTSHSYLFCVYIEQFLGSKETWLCPAQSMLQLLLYSC